MKAVDYSRSVAIDPALLEPTEAETRQRERIGQAAADMGYQTRLSIRRVGRECGLTELPGAVVYVNGDALWLGREDLTTLLPGEEP